MLLDLSEPVGDLVIDLDAVSANFKVTGQGQTK